MEFLAVFFAFLTALVLYVLPSVVAAVRGHSNFKAILALNLLAGWTALGWLAAFVWSLTDNVVAPNQQW